MKILLTGSSGFIGQHLLPRLQAIGEVHELKSDLTHHTGVQLEIKKS